MATQSNVLNTLEFTTQAEQLRVALNLVREYQRLHDGLSDMIEEGRLVNSDIPDDFKWLADSLEKIGNMDGNAPTKIDATIRKDTRGDDGDTCRTCGAKYAQGGDGYDGQCPDCADKTEAAREEA